MKTNDQPIHEDAMAYVADELPALERKRFADQLANDPALRAEVAGLESIRGQLLSLPETEPSPGLSNRIMEAIRAEQAEEAGRQKKDSNKWPAIAAIAACLALGIMVLAQLFKPG
ncbi:MAG: hypothetical protein ACKO2G_14185, partial [Verrucomicrobiales bacterium]